ncbi:MAG: hypothetical protein FD161_3343 [Limisphaerales bacterium]|nr:MAG: hypothetical protein FD161_3343 [Limisphaerales bacterium]KAG0507858.1 MAG: hypothetical protein E1N63_3009 [Limisphaerales bacterium]TXT48666.1 MAG: hypothetical protein FD140_3601 [Limisphaerales bacterium]
MKPEPAPPQFLNVDLEVLSKADLAEFAKSFGTRKVSVLYCDRQGAAFFAALELVTMRRTPEQLLARFCDLLEAMPPSAANLWRAANQRTFDIGIQSGDAQPHLALRISPKTLARVTALGATIAITVYPSKL